MVQSHFIVKPNLVLRLGWGFDNFVRMELLVLQEHEGAKEWWTSGTDMGLEETWYWAVNLKLVPEFVWETTNGSDGTERNCLYLETGAAKYYANDKACSTKLFPICQRKGASAP